MSRSAMRMTPAQHARLLTEPQSLSKSYGEFKAAQLKLEEQPRLPPQLVSETTNSSLPPHLTDSLPQYRLDERLKFPAEDTRSPSRLSAQRDFKSASDKLDALTRKLSIIHRSLVSSDSAPSSANELTTSTPTTKPAPPPPMPVLPNPETELEMRLMQLEARVKEVQNSSRKAATTSREDAAFQESVSQAFSSMETRLIELESTIFSRLHMVETKNQEYLENKIANCENRLMLLDTRVCTGENKNLSIDADVGNRIMTLEDEVSVQNQRVEALRRDVDKLVESQALLIKTLSTELRSLRLR